MDGQWEYIADSASCGSSILEMEICLLMSKMKYLKHLAKKTILNCCLISSIKAEFFLPNKTHLFKRRKKKSLKFNKKRNDQLL